MGGVERAGVAVVGAGAAGLMASIFAARTMASSGATAGIAGGAGGRVVALEGAKTLGAKILVAGGGRCNVTHHEVTERAYSGGSRRVVARVLRRFDVERTVAFFAELGVELKREPTGKLFPTTDRARTVLDALINAARDAGAEIRRPARVETIRREGPGFVVSGPWGEIWAERVILATGGRALPRSGSDGHGYELARGLGHTVTPRVFPALVPLVLVEGSPLRSLRGLTLEAGIELRSGTGKRLERFENSTLLTHFGLSGPAVMDMSRHLTAARFDDPGAHLVADWLPSRAREASEQELIGLGKRSVGRWARERLPERFGEALLETIGLDPLTQGGQLGRGPRSALLEAVHSMRLGVTGDRGFTHAEVTAGGVPLEEIDPGTMASRRCPGLYLCGEILDVDGRIGGFNFQWAWASGHIAGTAAGGPIDQA